MIFIKKNHTDSGVTRVGVTRGGNCLVSPYPIIPEKNLTTFLVIACESDDFC